MAHYMGRDWTGHALNSRRMSVTCGRLRASEQLSTLTAPHGYPRFSGNHWERVVF